MESCHRSVVPRVHGLQHIERFRPAALANNNAIRPHPECIDDQVANGYLPCALCIARSGLQPHHVSMFKRAQFCGVLDRDDALILRQDAG